MATRARRSHPPRPNRPTSARYRCAEHLFDDTPGDIVAHEFMWTIADYLHAVTRAGNRLIRFEELGDQPEGWERAPMRGLPEHLLIAARRDASASTS